MIKLLSSFFHPNPSDYETWLEKLAIKGWYPKKLNQWSTLIMVFEKSDPMKYRYVLDLQTTYEADYVKIYEEFGWELCGKIANTFLWRMKYNEKRPESFSDEQTLQERNNKFLKAISSLYIFHIILEIIITLFFIANISIFDFPVIVKYLVVLFFSYAYTIYLTKIVLDNRRKVR